MSLSRRIARKLVNYDDPKSPASRVRAKRAGHLMALMESASLNKGSVRILDVGGNHRYWNVVPTETLERLNVEVTLLNLPGSPTAKLPKRFTKVEGDATNLPFDDHHFDIAHSNSVVEHVGSWEQMMAFASEIRRVAPMYLVQTPHFWFPVEPHAMTPFLHWLPEPLRVALVRRVALGFWQKSPSVEDAMRLVQGTHLLDESMMRALFPDGHMELERMLGLPKSIIMIRT